MVIVGLIGKSGDFLIGSGDFFIKFKFRGGGGGGEPKIFSFHEYFGDGFGVCDFKLMVDFLGVEFLQSWLCDGDDFLDFFEGIEAKAERGEGEEGDDYFMFDAGFFLECLIESLSIDLLCRTGGGGGDGGCNEEYFEVLEQHMKLISRGGVSYSINRETCEIERRGKEEGRNYGYENVDWTMKIPGEYYRKFYELFNFLIIIDGGGGERDRKN